ncbi:hypothetical protein BDC45DRAFT_568433 [Circinella umbellata]|nr:hypothetical protein BDC45DRAFT_568433 [Circinella umbellata]
MPVFVKSIVVMGRVTQLLLCATLWSVASAQLDTEGKSHIDKMDDDPMGDDSSGSEDPTGDDTFSGDPTGDDDPLPQPQPQPGSAPSPSQQQQPETDIFSQPTGEPAPTDNSNNIAPSPTLTSSATTSPTLFATNSSAEGNGGGNGGAIAGGIFGALGGLAILGAIVFFFIRKKRQQNNPAAATAVGSRISKQQVSRDDFEEFRPQNEEMIGYHAWNAASSSDMLASSARQHQPPPPPPTHQYIPGYSQTPNGYR